MTKRIIFTIIALTPLLFLIIFVSYLAAAIYRTNHLDHEKINKSLDKYLSEKRGESIPLPDRIIDAEDSAPVILVFGASSVVISDGFAFSDHLDWTLKKETNLGIRVVNLGSAGIDSLSIRLHVEKAIDACERKPDLAIFYYGHNDNTTAFQMHVFPKHINSFDLIMKTAYRFDLRSRRNKDIGYVFYSGVIRQRFFKSLQKTGLIKIKNSDFAIHFDTIFEYFKTNTEYIVDYLSERNIPMIFITPISNLHAEPFGDINETTYYYELGLKTPDYNQSTEYLIRAKDSEIYTIDIRAKSRQNDYLRSLKNENVFVLDLENKFIDEHFGFGYDEFMDYVHMKNSTHRVIAESIFDFIMNNETTKKTVSGRR